MKTIKILIVIIIILAIVFGIKVLGPKKSETNKGLTLEQVKEIVAKSENVKNFYYENTSETELNIIPYNKIPKSIKRKNNKKIMKIYYDGIDYIWVNDEENKVISISKWDHKDYPNKKVALIDYTDLYKENFHQKPLFDILLENMQEYEYKGEEKYNEYNCIMVNFIWYYEGKKIENELWIDKESGFIMKIIFKEDGKEIGRGEYNYKFNCVTDEDVKEPDLTNYAVEEMN